VQELSFEVWRQRHEQLLREAQRDHLVRQLRVARRSASSRPSGRRGRDQVRSQYPRGTASSKRENSMQSYPNHRAKDH